VFLVLRWPHSIFNKPYLAILQLSEGFGLVEADLEREGMMYED
jgi:hypothetical protein